MNSKQHQLSTSIQEYFVNIQLAVNSSVTGWMEGWRCSGAMGSSCDRAAGIIVSRALPVLPPALPLSHPSLSLSKSMAGHIVLREVEAFSWHGCPPQHSRADVGTAESGCPLQSVSTVGPSEKTPATASNIRTSTGPDSNCIILRAGAAK